MFSRFLLFFGAAGAGLCVAATGRRGFGARFHAKPCSFVNGHHVFGTKGAAGEPDVVLHSPQNLALSSTGTTSLGPKAPPASRTWCFTPRKPLLFRRRAPRLWDQRRCRRAGRGASPPANPCSFVDGHHVFGVKGAAGEPDVVLHSPQNLALSSTGTMSLGPKALGRRGLGARFPAKPCSFVNGHHVFGAKGAAGIRSHHYKS